MKYLSLRPYPGNVAVFRDLAALRKEYKRLTKKEYPYSDESGGGRFVKIERGTGEKDTVWMVYARKPHVLAHELTHVLFHVFDTIGADPQCGDGEPFCYMLSQLILDSK